MTREEAINECLKIQAFGISENQINAMELAISALSENKGEWIELPKAFNANENPCECSKCGHILSFMNGYPKSNFCPNCGADMRGE